MSINFQYDILKKWQAALNASPEVAGGTSRKRAIQLRGLGRKAKKKRISKACESIFDTGR